MTPLLDNDTADPRSAHAPDGTARTLDPRADADELPLDVVFDLLSNERRRRVLRYLRDQPETTLGDLAEHVASLEYDKPAGALSSVERKRVYVGLYQCHLPRMDDAGVVEFDENRKTVERGDNAGEVTRVLLPNDAGGDDTRAESLARGVRAVATTVWRWLRPPR